MIVIAHTDPTKSDSVFMNKLFVYGADCRCNVGFGFWQMAYASNAALNGDSLDAAIAAMRTLAGAMSEFVSFLPPNHTRLEGALEQSIRCLSEPKQRTC